ncbi:MAG: type II toxin-antitoxin system VapC family toxin [Candidatus Acidiferrales bacterium]
MTTTTGFEVLLLDSSGWLEYFTEDDNAALFAPYIEGNFLIIVPTIVLYEVHKKVLQGRGKAEAERVASQLMQRLIFPLGEDLALMAARVSVEFRLAMADAIVYATGLANQAMVITGDVDFQGLPGAMVIA